MKERLTVDELKNYELKAMNTAEKVFNDHPLEKENVDHNENLDGFMKSVFANEQSTENVDLKSINLVILQKNWDVLHLN